jgi:hypothetical protein
MAESRPSTNSGTANGERALPPESIGLISFALSIIHLAHRLLYPKRQELPSFASSRRWKITVKITAIVDESGAGIQLHQRRHRQGARRGEGPRGGCQGGARPEQRDRPILRGGLPRPSCHPGLDRRQACHRPQQGDGDRRRYRDHRLVQFSPGQPRKHNAENVIVLRGNPELAAVYRQNWAAHQAHSVPYTGVHPAAGARSRRPSRRQAPSSATASATSISSRAAPPTGGSRRQTGRCSRPRRRRKPRAIGWRRTVRHGEGAQKRDVKTFATVSKTW